MPAASSFEALKETISTAYPRLSKQLQQIARFALQRPNELALGTVATVADSAGVQPSALIRFANALDFGGFSELQQVFRARLLERSGSYRERIHRMRGDGAAAAPATGVLHELVGEAVNELGHLEDSVRRADLALAVRLICNAQRVHLLAQRRAFPVAVYLAYALGQLELKTQLLAGIGGMLADALRDVERRDVLVVASFQNYSAEVVEAAAGAHARGVPVIAITDSALSPLKPAARVCFELGSGDNPAFRSLVAPLCLAQALVVSAGHRLTEPKRPAARRRANAGTAGTA